MTRLFLYRELLGIIWIGACLMVLSGQDLRSREVSMPPVLLILPAAWLMPAAPGSRLLAAAAVIIITGAAAGLSRAAGRPMAFGMGDSALLLAMGAALGAAGAFAVWAAASLAAGALAAALLVTGRAGPRDTLPFVPFIAFGFLFLCAVI